MRKWEQTEKHKYCQYILYYHIQVKTFRNLDIIFRNQVTTLNNTKSLF